MINITIGDKIFEYEEGTSYREIVSDHSPADSLDVLLVKCDGKLFELHKKANRSCTLEFITAASPSGHYTYERSAVFVLLKAIHDFAPELSMDSVSVEFAIDNGLYIKINDFDIKPQDAAAIKSRMQTIIDAKIPIIKRNISTESALEKFKELGMGDKVNLFKYRRSSRANLYYIEDYVDYFYGYLVNDTGYIKYYDLLAYEGGLVLVLPSSTLPTVVEEFKPSKKLFKQLVHTEDILDESGLGLVSEINQEISNGGFTNIVLTQEGFMEKRIGDVAERISHDEKKKIILIAGPSSSGKTTFSHRLSIQLRSYGLNPIPIATDNYFVNRDKTPLDADGKPDFECLEAMDIRQFSDDMNGLLNGENVELPIYNFKTGCRESSGTHLQLKDHDVLVIEGIHCLDDKMVGDLPQENVFRIYICPITHLNIDGHNQINSSDCRLIRRIVRDNRTRNYSAADTIAMWPSVRRGDNLYVTPFQDSADVIFNSSLLYELNVLKPYAEALLFAIDKDDPSYTEANRLLKLIDYLLTIPSSVVPSNSLLSEFIGGNIFNV